MGTLERAWPVCPRPFADETFGSWFGRAAARYRMGVDQLAEATGTKLQLGQDCIGWLTMPAPHGRLLLHLATQARINPDLLEGLAAGDSAPAPNAALWYCHKCFFLNPVEVESPYWRAAWLSQVPGSCSIHRVAYDRLPVAALSKARNMAKLLTYIGRHRATFLGGEDHPPAELPPNANASAFRDHG